jgi:UDP-4-amino-4,6-dideoxy-N-acetyl-beta-L-altrosamine N-acetyltransferase
MSVVMAQFGCLRGIKSEELELMLSWRNASNVRLNMYTRHIISLEEHMAWWKRTQLSTDRQYFMYEKNGEPTGIVSFTNIDPANKNASWAFYAAPQAPKGTGTRMEWLAIEYAFNVLGLHKLHCEVLAFNEPVIKLHQKFGFRVEGVLRQHHKVEDNFVDIYKLGILFNEWAEKSSPMKERILKISE